ncbi:glyoxalase [Paraburkholderia ginsengiterrae]|uniref:Glyoxalase n=1 Tax=Paraburkholderia ginsengiterrae TaxID=1462993 RepID=A0A1A9NF44_9BURK|nr:VOC family protein [Paraburkholderia ginsengiterrae]OAJ60227.1 glyoxalase [Paraburkholderia ginsengiterrae]OAJ64768.1 glyoxalase [Paraburkholderia ginsengiterrae]
MKFASVRVVTRDIDGQVEFYQRLSGIEAVRPADGFAEIRFGGATLAISSEHLIELFNVGAATAAANQSAILEFEVEDVDAVFERMCACGTNIVMPTTLMPWGNRSLLLRDPDGNLVNIFSRPKN